MTGHIDLIKATPEDAPLVAHLHVSGWRDGYAGLLPDTYLASLNIDERTQKWTHYLKEGSNVWMATYNGFPASVVSFGPPLNPVPNSVTDGGELTLLYTLGQFYRHGLGEVLFNHARKSLASDRFKYMYLWVLEENMKGRFFYQKMGGTIIPDASHTAVIDQQPYREIAYGWTLSPSDFHCI